MKTIIKFCPIWDFWGYKWTHGQRSGGHSLHSWNTPPPLPPMLKGGTTFQKLRHLGGGVPKFLLDRGYEPEKMGLIKKWWGATFLLLYSSIRFTVCVRKVKFTLLLFSSSVFWVSHGRTICIFLIITGSVQKMLTAYLN